MKGEVRSYKDLIVWQRAKSATLRCIRLANEAPRSLGSEIVFRQAIAATSSMCANIAEGYGRRSGAEYIRFLEIAYGSACEAENWAMIIQEAGLGPQTEWRLVQSEALEVQRMLATIMTRIRDRVRHPAALREADAAYDPWADEAAAPSSDGDLHGHP